jgi:hypothetical protein
MCNTGKWWIFGCPSQEQTAWKTTHHYSIKVCEIQNVIYDSVKYNHETNLGQKWVLFILNDIVKKQSNTPLYIFLC